MEQVHDHSSSDNDSNSNALDNSIPYFSFNIFQLNDANADEDSSRIPPIVDLPLQVTESGHRTSDRNDHAEIEKSFTILAQSNSP